MAAHAPPAWILDDTPRSARVARAIAPTRVGAIDPAASTPPLIAEPLVVTHDGAMQYISTVNDLVTCLDKDARDELIYQNPAKLHADASNLFEQARETDGCTTANPNLCPRPDEDPKPITPTEINNRLAADALRTSAYGKEAAADAMDKRAADRGLKNDAAGNAQVNAELSFYADLRTLADDTNRTYTEISSASVAGSAEWKKAQALDIRYQALRVRYAALGFSPSCALPNFTEKSFPWGWIAAGVIVVVGAVVVGQVVFPLVRMGVR